MGVDSERADSLWSRREANFSLFEKLSIFSYPPVVGLGATNLHSTDCLQELYRDLWSLSPGNNRLWQPELRARWNTKITWVHPHLTAESVG